MDPGTALVQIITVGVVIGVLVFILASFGTVGAYEIGALALVGVAAIVWIAVRTRRPGDRN